eukprot:3941644-Rhodomonas_salina.8
MELWAGSESWYVGAVPGFQWCVVLVLVAEATLSETARFQAISVPEITWQARGPQTLGDPRLWETPDPGGPLPRVDPRPP